MMSRSKNNQNRKCIVLKFLYHKLYQMLHFLDLNIRIHVNIQKALVKKRLWICAFSSFFFNFDIFYKMLFSDGVGNDCFLRSCWDLNGGSSVHSVNYSRQRVGLHEVAIPKQIGELLFDFWLSELLPYYKVYTLKYVTVCRDVGKRKGWKLVMAWRE